MSASPLVSVVIPFFNAGSYLQEAIQSVFDQTWDGWELLLVDDGSSDGSAATARRWAERHPGRVRILVHEAARNRGVSASRNLGIAHARGNFLGFIDADDVWFPYKLKEQVELMHRYPEVDLVRGRLMYWHSWNGGLDEVPGLNLPFETPLSPPAGLWLCSPLGRGRAPGMSDLLVRRQAVERAGGFEESFPGLYEDHVFMSKFYLRSTMLAWDRVWARYRIHPRQTCAALAAEVGSVRARFLRWLGRYWWTQRDVPGRAWMALGKAILAHWLDSRRAGLPLHILQHPEHVP